MPATSLRKGWTALPERSGLQRQLRGGWSNCRQDVARGVGSTWPASELCYHRLYHSFVFLQGSPNLGQVFISSNMVQNIQTTSADLFHQALNVFRLRTQVPFIREFPYDVVCSVYVSKYVSKFVCMYVCKYVCKYVSM